MDERRFDDIARSLSRARSRRGVLAAFAGLLAAAVGGRSADAKPAPRSCQRKCGQCEGCNADTGQCVSLCKPGERCHGNRCEPLCAAERCEVYYEGYGCGSRCLRTCQTCRHGTCVDTCDTEHCYVCSAQYGGYCAYQCGAGEQCVAGMCQPGCGPCQKLDSSTNACTPSCPVIGQTRDPNNDCACVCPGGPPPCSGSATCCHGVSSDGLCCIAPEAATCCSPTAEGAGDGWAMCCGGTVPCPPCPSGSVAAGGVVTQCNDIGGDATAGCPDA